MTPGGTRAVIGWAALRAAYSAHMGAAHGGLVRATCRTCRRYLAACVDARAREAGS